MNKDKSVQELSTEMLKLTAAEIMADNLREYLTNVEEPFILVTGHDQDSRISYRSAITCIHTSDAIKSILFLLAQIHVSRPHEIEVFISTLNRTHLLETVLSLSKSLVEEQNKKDAK